MAGFGGSVKLTGESEYRQAIQRCTQSLQSMSSALKSQTADFNSNDKSMKSTAQAQKQLNDTIQKQQQAVNQAKSTLAGYSTEMQKQSTLHNQLNKEYRAAVVELDKIKKSSGENSAEYKKQAQTVDELGKKLSDSAYKLDENKSAMAQLKSEINNSNKVIATAKQQIDELGKETEESGEQARKSSEGYTVFKNILANLGTQAINSAINGLKNLGGAFVDVGKQAIGSYAEYEQLVGGVETLFKDSAGIVEGYANEAYKTAGLSANEYMNTVTSFSASLLQSLGGDTKKAAEYGNRAVTDMSDNANKMGTDIGMIQNAYQGFAKQNYTMLDNLKLGYGGTKTEMERLIKDASQLTDVQKELGITVDANDMSFGNIVNAISVVQKEMGIMGTTSKEASETIQGSTNSMKSAWQNMLTGMADENANFEQLATNFIGTLITEDGKGGVLGTLIPRVTQVITGMSEAIATGLPMVIQSVVPLIQQNLPIILNAVQQALETIVGVLPTIVDAISPLIPQIISMLLSMLPQLIDAGVEILLSLVDGITKALPDLIKMLPKIIKQICDTLIKNLPQIIKAGIEILVALIEGLSEAIPELIDYIPEIVETIVEVLIDNLPMLIEAAVKLMVALSNGLIQSLPKLATMVPRIITTIVSTLIKNLPQIIQGGVKILASLIEGIGKNIGNLVTKAKELGQKVLDQVLTFPSKMLNAGKDLVKGIWSGISGSLTWIKSKIKGWVGNVTKFIKNLFGIHSPSKLFRDEIGTNLALGIGEGFSDEMSNVTKEMQDAIPTSFDTSINTGVNGLSGSTTTSNYYELVDAFKEALGEMKIELDDENMGKFIDKTVARTIYS